MASRESAPPTLRRLDVNLGDASYSIVVGTQWLRSFGEQLRNVAADMTHAMVVCDVSISSTYAELVRHSVEQQGVRVDLCTLPSGEASKSVEQLVRVWNWMLSRRGDRRSVVIAVGGGVIGDLAGFAAATYQRGVRLVQVPTTLLSQVDSSVGGKTGVNLPAAKNMVGAFWQPILVAIDTHSLGSLPQRDYLSGLAEVVKYGVIERPELFQWLEEHASDLVARSPDAIEHAVVESCATKAAVVGDDERETSGRRAILNYGHTFAHAIEATAGYGRFMHGEAVSIGMRMAARFAVARGMAPEELETRQTALLTALGLPIVWPQVDLESMIDAMWSDKKNTHGKMRLILPTRIGHVEMVSDATVDEIKSAIEACRE